VLSQTTLMRASRQAFAAVALTVNLPAVKAVVALSSVEVHSGTKQLFASTPPDIARAISDTTALPVKVVSTLPPLSNATTSVVNAAPASRVYSLPVALHWLVA